MRKTAVFTAACAVLALVLSLAIASPDTAARPAGVPPDAWIPLTADAGFVVTDAGSQRTRPGLASSVRGYLMARRGGKWVRLDPEGAAHLMPMK